LEHLRTAERNNPRLPGLHRQKVPGSLDLGETWILSREWFSGETATGSTKYPAERAGLQPASGSTSPPLLIPNRHTWAVMDVLP